MNKRIWMVVILATALGACSAQSQLAAPDRCQAGKKITINHGPRGIIVAPPNLCVKPGDTITVNTTPKNEPLKTEPTKAQSNNPGHNWLNGSNSGHSSEFTLEVPQNVPGCPTECTYKYTIVTNEIIFDPMITIRR